MAPEDQDHFSASHHELSTVIIGDITRWEAEGRNIASFGAFTFARLEDLSPMFLLRTNPQIVLSPLVCDSFDAMDVASRLVALGYKGRYRALSAATPDDKVIRAEIGSIAPALDFEVLDITEGLAR